MAAMRSSITDFVRRLVARVNDRACDDGFDLSYRVLVLGEPIPLAPRKPLDEDVAKRLEVAERYAEERELDDVGTEILRLAAQLPPERVTEVLDEVRSRYRTSESAAVAAGVPPRECVMRRGASRAPRTRRVVRRGTATRAGSSRRTDDDPHERELDAGALA
jgi:hypothetical protein